MVKALIRVIVFAPLRVICRLGITCNKLVPMELIRFSMALWDPSPRATIMITEPTPIITPREVRRLLMRLRSMERKQVCSSWTMFIEYQIFSLRINCLPSMSSFSKARISVKEPEDTPIITRITSRLPFSAIYQRLRTTTGVLVRVFP